MLIYCQLIDTTCGVFFVFFTISKQSLFNMILAFRSSSELESVELVNKNSTYFWNNPKFQKLTLIFLLIVFVGVWFYKSDPFFSVGDSSQRSHLFPFRTEKLSFVEPMIV